MAAFFYEKDRMMLLMAAY